MQLVIFIINFVASVVNYMLMKKLFTNPKALALMALGLLGPQAVTVMQAQPADPPPPPLVATISGVSLAIIILSCVGYGVYTIYKKNHKTAKAA